MPRFAAFEVEGSGVLLQGFEVFPDPDDVLAAGLLAAAGLLSLVAVGAAVSAGFDSGLFSDVLADGAALLLPDFA